MAERNSPRAGKSVVKAERTEKESDAAVGDTALEGINVNGLASVPEEVAGEAEDNNVPVIDAEGSAPADDINTRSNVRVEEYLRLEHLQQLQKYFEKFRAESVQDRQESKVQRQRSRRKSGFMNRSEFKATVTEILGTTDCLDQLDRLFSKLDTYSQNLINWEEFVTYLLLYYQELNDGSEKKSAPFRTDPTITLALYNRQEVTEKIIAIENPLRYVSGSKEGIVTVWEPKLLTPETSYYAIKDNQDQPGQKRNFKNWVTDMVYMQNCKKIAISTTGRDIYFFDCSTAQHFAQFHLYGLADVPNCMVYWYDPKSPSSNSVLVYGDTLGALGVLAFKQPVSQLFDMRFMENKRLQEVFVKDLDRGSRFVKFTYIPDVHGHTVSRLRHIPDGTHVISCSANENTAVVVYDVQRKKASYTFRIHKGCDCFEYNKALNALVTGSSDHNARLWNPYVPSKPTAILKGHAMGVIDVAIHERLQQIFTYARDATIKVWDAKEQSCIQTITLKLPGSVFGRLPEHGHFVFHLQPPPINTLLVGCNDLICSLKCGEVEEVTSLYPLTHDSQLCAAIYNRSLKQVATGCDDSTIGIWDVETGNRNMLIAHAHGDEEITCMAFDASHRRLITGARNGTSKIWNMQNGHCIGFLAPVDDVEVTGVVHIPDKKCFVGVGWSQRITVYDDTRQAISGELKAAPWKSHHHHRDDILAVAYCPPNLLATASFDGELLVWSTETQGLFLRLRRGQKSEMSWKLRQLNVHVGSLPNSRPNSRHRKVHKPEAGYPAPVDALLFLTMRLKAAGGGRYAGGLLVSSEGGIIKWWSLFGSHHLLGEFAASDDRDESVLAMCADESGRYLVTGDTAGYAVVWDVEKYCITPDDAPVQSRPSSVARWHAHGLAIVSVDWVNLEYGQFVVTSSVDKSARLWSMIGQNIGTFGQAVTWSLQDEATWLHPKTPWTLIDEQVGRIPERKKSGKENRKKSQIDTSEFSIVSDPVSINQVTEKKSARLSLDDFSVPSTTNRDVVTKINAVRREQTSLGIKAEQDFLRMREGRAFRRGCYGGIDLDKTSRMNGQVCSPYHALTTPDVLDINLPHNLPVTPRMLSKGYTSENLNEATLRRMDLKFRTDDALEFLAYSHGIKLPLLAVNATVRFLTNARRGEKATKKKLHFSRALPK